MTQLLFACLVCGRDFALDAVERAWYEGKGWMLPKRCPRCRAERRAQRAAAQAVTYDAAAAMREGR